MFRAALLVLIAGGCGRLRFDEQQAHDGQGAADTTDAMVAAYPQLALGSAHTCARTTHGTVRCWGDGSTGQLGTGSMQEIGDNEPPSTAPDVPLGGDSAMTIDAEGLHTCALMTTGAVRCWGTGSFGVLGGASLANIGDDEPASASGEVQIGEPAVALSVGGHHVCVVLGGGRARCWGRGTFGELGNGMTVDIGDDETPLVLSDLVFGQPVLQIDAGGDNTCAVLADHTIRCWGTGNHGQNGYGVPGDFNTPPTPPVLVGIPAKQIAVGEHHVCALLDDGSALCWGESNLGQRGCSSTVTIGDDESASLSGLVASSSPFVQISAQGDHTCALNMAGQVLCWGENVSGQLGIGSTQNIGDDENGGARASLEAPAVSVVVGAEHTCAVLTTGAVKCWGHGTSGCLGYGNTNSIGDDELPTAVGAVMYE